MAETGNEIDLNDTYEKLIEFIEAHGIRFDRTANEDGQVVHPGGSGIVPISRVRAALRFIGEWDDRKRWVDVGIYVKAALGDAGYDPWAEWSAQSQKFGDAEARATWASFIPTRTGGGQLFQMAKAAGWRWTPKDDGVTIDLQAILELFRHESTNGRWRPNKLKRQQQGPQRSTTTPLNRWKNPIRPNQHRLLVPLCPNRPVWSARSATTSSKLPDHHSRNWRLPPH